MVYVFLSTVIIAFIGMFYVIYTEKDLKNFLDYTHIRENAVVHPLFNHFRKVIDEERTTKKEKLKNLNTTYFYSHYIKKNLPVLVEDGAADWPAINKWHLSYLQ